MVLKILNQNKELKMFITDEYRVIIHSTSIYIYPYNFYKDKYDWKVAMSLIFSDINTYCSKIENLNTINDKYNYINNLSEGFINHCQDSNLIQNLKFNFLDFTKIPVDKHNKLFELWVYVLKKCVQIY